MSFACSTTHGACFSLIERTQRIAQRLLKRSLGDRTWNASEITAEIRRLNDDLQNYLSVHTVGLNPIIQSAEQPTNPFSDSHAGYHTNVSIQTIIMVIEFWGLMFVRRSNTEQYNTLSNSVEEIMAKVIFSLNTR